ncbi:hypothetical protein HanRHA438_Chr13g0582301 [Helianthus annuus]|nr:hypothetical protein HanRHA438_Chr13g0582301 [Helianthus annuus]
MPPFDSSSPLYLFPYHSPYPDTLSKTSLSTLDSINIYKKASSKNYNNHLHKPPIHLMLIQ